MRSDSVAAGRSRVDIKGGQRILGLRFKRLAFHWLRLPSRFYTDYQDCNEEDPLHSLHLGTECTHAMNIYIRLFCSLIIAAAHVSAGGQTVKGLYHLTESIIGQEFYNHFTWEAIKDPTHGRVSVARLCRNRPG